MSIKVSVVVPAHNAQEELPFLFESLVKQGHNDFEVIVVDDCSEDDTFRVAGLHDCRRFRLTRNRGPAACRNIGAKNAAGEILLFTDSDCRVESDWVERAEACFYENDISAIMGKVVLMPSNFVGNSISALGFPAGGSVGFDKIWKVDQRGFTDSLSTCNCAIKKDVFEKIGGFDESFPLPGGEDTLLAYHLGGLNYSIKYCPDVVVYHAARDSLRDFMRWQFRRGISSYIFSKKVPNKSSFLFLRVWSTMNILKACGNQKIFPMVVFLLIISFFVQSFGFLSVKRKNLR